MLLTTLIPNFNGKHLLEKYLPFLFESLKCADVTYEVLIVDDCSTDDSVHFITTTYPEIQVIRNQQNLGFAKSCNIGINLAQGDKLLLLNTDIQLTPSYIKICLEKFTTKNTFAVMGKAIDESAQPQTTGVLFKQGIFRIKKYQNVVNDETHFVSGANSIYDTQKLKELGGFNTIFSPYYFEDDDLSFRAMKNGWKSYFVPEAACYHVGSSTIKSCAKRTKIKIIYFRNKMIFNRLHSKSSELGFDLMNLCTNILPKYCLGSFWIWKSYNEFRKARLLKYE